MLSMEIGIPAGSPVSVATRHSPWDSPAVSNRNIPNFPLYQLTIVFANLCLINYYLLASQRFAKLDKMCIMLARRSLLSLFGSTVLPWARKTAAQNATEPPAVVAGIPANYDEARVGEYTLPDPLVLSN